MLDIEAVAVSLTALYGLDRLAKAELVQRFFARPQPPAPEEGWPLVALIQPVTRGVTNLAANLEARALLNYPGEIQHIVVCDTADTDAQAICLSALPEAMLVLADPDIPGAPVASKIAKMTAGVVHLGATGVVCFVDDDILLPPGTLQTLVAPLYADTPAGATFGLACQTSWETVWETLMSGFVNANALTGYVPLTFFTEPYTITGHLFALRRSVFAQTGDMDGLAGRFDDDHEIARRVRALGMSAVQTPLVYRVANALPTTKAYFGQMRRWFVIPRQGMNPYLTSYETTVTTLLSVGNLLPPLVLLCAALVPGPTTFACAALTFLAFLMCYALLEARYLPAQTPGYRIGWLLVVVFLTPLQVLLSLCLPGDRIVWRGQAYHMRRGGAMEVSREVPEETNDE
jgi:ceramide glucosyltransferase